MSGPNRVAVIGATGFIGSHVVERLLSDTQAEVLAVAASEKRRANLSAAERPYRFEECDVLNAAQIREAMHRFVPEVVYYFVAHPDGQESFEQIQRCLQVNLAGLANTLEAASSAGTRLFVYGDSTKVYGSAPFAHGPAAVADPAGSYAITKLAGWQLAKLVSSMTGMAVVSVRPEMTYGARQAFNLIVHARKCLLEGQPIRLQGGAQTRDPLFVDDLVDALLAIPHHPECFGEAICLGGGKEYTILEICQHVAAVLGCRADIEVNALPPRLTEIWRSYSDNSHALRLLGWTPKTSLEEGLTLTMEGLSRRAGSGARLARKAHAAA